MVAVAPGVQKFAHKHLRAPDLIFWAERKPSDLGEFPSEELFTEMSNGAGIAPKEIRVYKDVSASNRLDLSMGDLSRKIISGCE